MSVFTCYSAGLGIIRLFSGFPQREAKFTSVLKGVAIWHEERVKLRMIMALLNVPRQIN